MISNLSENLTLSTNERPSELTHSSATKDLILSKPNLTSIFWGYNIPDFLMIFFTKVRLFEVELKCICLEKEEI
jgi:hypothetical protein